MGILGSLKKMADALFSGSSTAEMALQPEEILQLVGGAAIETPLDFEANGYRDAATMLRTMASRFGDDFKNPLNEMALALDSANADALSREFGAVVPVETMYELLDTRNTLIEFISVNFMKAVTGDTKAQTGFMESAALYRGLVNIADAHQGTLYFNDYREDRSIRKILDALPATNAPASGAEQNERFNQYRRAVEEQRQRGAFTTPAFGGQ